MNLQNNVRAMIRGDLPDIATIVDATGLFPSDMLADISDGYLSGAGADLWLSGEQHGTVVGFVFCQPERLTERCWNMLALAVDPAHHGQGFGSKLVAALEAMLAKRGERLLLVETSGTDAFERTRAFYDKQGYQREARIRDYYADGDDKVIFRKALREG